jgi:carbon monoxide dehydrogenase subunit G
VAHVEEHTIVQAPIQPVFDFIADHRRALSWLTGFTKFAWIGGPENGLGARVRTEGEILGFSVTTDLEIVEFVPPRRLASRSTGRIKSTTTWLLDPVEGGTAVTFVGDYTLPFALRLVGDRAVEELVGGQVRQSLINLRRRFTLDAPTT